MPARIQARKPTGGGVELLFLRDLGPERGGSVGGAGQAEQAPQARDSRSRWALTGWSWSRISVTGTGPSPPPTCRACWAAAARCRSRPTSARLPSPSVVTRRSTRATRVPPRLRRPASTSPGGCSTRQSRPGARLARITLHVGVGTFMPVRTERLEEHSMHAEYYSVPAGRDPGRGGCPAGGRGRHHSRPHAGDVGRDRRGGRGVEALRVPRLPVAGRGHACSPTFTSRARRCSRW